MSTEFAAVAFLVALAATLGASEVLVWGLSRLGLKLGLAAGLLGLLTALGADSPEIASASSAVFSGAGDVGVGVILGSNLFNLAALLGLPGLLAGRLPLPRLAPVVDGAANLLVTLVAAGMLLGVVPARAAVAAFLLILAVYATVLALPPRRVRRLPLPGWAIDGILLLSSQVHGEEIVPGPLRAEPAWHPVWFLPVALAVIVAGSIVMVMAAVQLGERWHVPAAVLGAVILASITGLPNLYAAVRLARRGDGATVVSEAFNSNTLNLVAGLGLPALVLGASLPAGAPAVGGTLAWLGGLSVAAIALATLQRGLTRTGGAAIVVVYAAFLAVLLRGSF
jgi:cation:H+ antiporter